MHRINHRRWRTLRLEQQASASVSAAISSRCKQFTANRDTARHERSRCDASERTSPAPSTARMRTRAVQSLSVDARNPRVLAARPRCEQRARSCRHAYADARSSDSSAARAGRLVTDTLPLPTAASLAAPLSWATGVLHAGHVPPCVSHTDTSVRATQVIMGHRR